MNKINHKKINELLSESLLQDALFEYDTTNFSKFQIEEKQESCSISVKVNEYDSMINLRYDTGTFMSFCNCKQSKESSKCIHVALGCLKFNEYVEKQQSSVKLRQSDNFRLEILKNTFNSEKSKEQVFIIIQLSKIKDGLVKINLRSSIVGLRDYKISSMSKFIKKIIDKKNLSFGSITYDNYEIELSSRLLFEKLKPFVAYYDTLKIDIESNLFKMSDIKDLLMLANNADIIYDNQEYLIKTEINDIVLSVNSLSDGYELILSRCDNYEKISDELVINRVNQVLYVLDEKQITKVDLVNSFNAEKKILVDKTNVEEFNNDILPKLFNEFSVNIDPKLSFEIVDDKLNIQLYCYLQNSVIHIDPRFMYGTYNANAVNENILIRRSAKAENQIINLLLDNGYVYDYYKKEFVISAEKKQFIFLTKTIHNLKHEAEVLLDTKLKNALLNINQSSFSVNINNSEGNYFELDFELKNIDISEIKNILKSYKLKKDFHKLNNDSFISLLDEKVIAQLELVEELVSSSEIVLNKYRVPKYRAMYLKYNLDNHFDNIAYNEEFNNYLSEIQNIEKLENISFETFELREYQQVGLDWLNSLYKANLGALLADEMGLGKTIQVISFLKYNNVSNALIVVPKALLYNWKNEFDKYAPELKVVIVEGSVSKREALISKNKCSSIMLCAYSSIGNDLELLTKDIFDILVIDEAQYIKNFNSKVSNSVKQLKANFYVALSGTPIENNLGELWSIFDFLLPNFLGDFKTFKSKFISKNEIDLKQIINPFVLRRLKKDVLTQLPDKIENTIICEMNDQQKQLYAGYSSSVQSEVKQYLNSKNLGSKHLQVLSHITRLRQIAIDPRLYIHDYDGESAKLNVFMELVDEIIENEQKVIVFSQYTSLLKLLKDKLNENNIKYYYLDGDVRPKQRMMDVERFNKNKIPVYLISLKAGGVGLNLTSASNVIIYDPWWNPAVENQAIDRAHRIGQSKSVNVYRLISRLTIEQKILQLKQNKMDLLNNTFDEKTTDIKTLSTEDLVDLLSVTEQEDD